MTSGNTENGSLVDPRPQCQKPCYHVVLRSPSSDLQLFNELDAASLRHSLSDWETELRDGELRVELRADDNFAISTLNRIISDNFEARGISNQEIKKTLVALDELIRNVAMHAGDAENRCAIIMRVRSKFSSHIDVMEIVVADRGAGFDVAKALHKVQEDLRLTTREHGLLRLIRYGTSLRQHRLNPHAMIWLRRKRPGAQKSVINNLPKLDHIIYRCQPGGAEDIICIKNEVYWSDEIINHLMISDEFMSIAFEPIRRSALNVIFYEVTGIHSTVITFSPTEMLGILHKFMTQQIPFKEIVVFADAEREDNIALSQFSHRHSVRFFEDEHECLSYLYEATSTSKL